jgi:hypothetical protein
MPTTAATGSDLSVSAGVDGSAACGGRGSNRDPTYGGSVRRGPTSTVNMLLASLRVGSAGAACVVCRSSRYKVTRGLARNAMHHQLSRTPGPKDGLMFTRHPRGSEGIWLISANMAGRATPGQNTRHIATTTWRPPLDYSASFPHAGCQGRSVPEAVPVGPRYRLWNLNRTGRVVPLTMLRRRWSAKTVVRKPGAMNTTLGPE